MSDEYRPVRLAKWPFYLADLVLCGIIVFVLYQLGTFEGTTDTIIVAACLVAAAIAAWISIFPWLKEHDTSLHLQESANLKTSVEQIKDLDKVADLIRQSNSQWQSIQDASARTVASAREITDRMKAEAEEFMKFLSSANDQERAGLRLEVEKLRRMEGDWIKVTVQILDHVYAVFRAAERSGQRNLIAQLTNFQNACRDVSRRMGLAVFVPEIGEPFEPRAHQLPDSEAAPAQGARIVDVLASGFTYQGQLLRRALVTLESPSQIAEEQPVQSTTPFAEPPEGSREPESSTQEPEATQMAEPDAGTAPVSQVEPAEIPTGDEVFEDVHQSDVAYEHDQPAESSPEDPNPGPEKKSPQKELPF